MIIITWIFLTRIIKILKMVTPLCGYTVGKLIAATYYCKHHRIANSVAIFKIFRIRVK